MTWSARQYSKFEAERNRPVVDLLAHVQTSPVRLAADIGCGPGNSTALLADHYPAASVTGMDSSADMIDAARQRLPDVHFEVDDIATWRNHGPFDVILANAALQWVPDHVRLLPMLLGRLAPGGSLAVQVPDNLAEPSHVLARDLATGRWPGRLDRAWESWDNRHPADFYHRVLSEAGASVDIWRTSYFHQLAGPDAIVEWFKGTMLRPFLDLLDAAERTDFLTAYRQLIADAYPTLPDGTVLLPFPRLFIVAQRPSALVP